LKDKFQILPRSRGSKSRILFDSDQEFTTACAKLIAFRDLTTTASMGNPSEVESGEVNAGYVATETLEKPPPYSSGKFYLWF